MPALIAKLRHIINGIKWSAWLVFLVAYRINSEKTLRDLPCIIYQRTDMLPEIFSSSPDTRLFVARKLHGGASPRVILSDKHECWTARKNF
jgi:hypothetical protein